MNVYLLWRLSFGQHDLEGVYLSKHKAKQEARRRAAETHAGLRSTFTGLGDPEEFDKVQVSKSGYSRRSIFEIKVTNEDLFIVGERTIKDSPLDALASIEDMTEEA